MNHHDKPSLDQLLVVSRDAVGVLGIGICHRDPVNDLVSIVAMSPLGKDEVADTSHLLDHRVGSHTVAIGASIELRHIFHDGQPYAGPIEVLCQGVVDPTTRDAFVRMTGFRYVSVLPMVVDDEVWGAVAFYHREPLTDQQTERADSVLQLVTRFGPPFRRPLYAWRRSGRARPPRAMWLRAEEKFRREVAEELHGRIQTKLLMVWHGLKQCQEEGAPTFTVDVSERLQGLADELETIREQDVRQLSHRLHPATIRVALRPALRQIASRFREAAEVSMRWDPEMVRYDDPLQNRIPEAIRLTTYRVVEEATLNAVRHGKAAHIICQLALDHHRFLQVTITDDGEGFSSTELKPGLGLSLMASRVREANGRLTIESVVGQGTVIQVRLPLDLKSPEISLRRISSAQAVDAL